MAVRRVIYVPHGRSRIVNHASPQCLGAENQAGTGRLVHAFMLKRWNDAGMDPISFTEPD